MQARKNQIFISIVFAFVILMAPGAWSGESGKVYAKVSLDDIYNSIRNAAPVYQWDESIVTFNNQGMQLVCTLTIPRTSMKCPIVITLNGFGGVRDSATIPGTEEGIFKRNARIMAEQGLATLRVDFRGQGDSDGTYDMTTFETQISDVLVAIEYIRKNLRHQVNKNLIGVLGFSQGGLAGGIAASRSKFVDSLVLWSAPSSPPICYEGLMTKEKVKEALAMPDGSSVTLPVVADGTYYFDVTLGKAFFEGLFTAAPLREIANYTGPLMAVSGLKDPIVWPQPICSQAFLDVHEGEETLVKINADHAFDFWDGPVPERLDDAIYWSTAWFLKTLK
ncbi:MAG: alpha/beta hydrolase [bacterium]|nr:alpha/beta hydrolase [bacterium]